MEFLKKLFENIKIHLENYLAILLAISILVIDILGIDIGEDKLQEITLMVLSLLAFGAIRQTELFNRFKESLHDLNSSTLSLSGIRNTYAGSPVHDFDQWCSTAKREIRLLHTWIPGPSPLPVGLFNAVKSNDKLVVKILLLNPNSKIALQRLQDLGHPQEISTLINALPYLFS